MPTSRKIRDGWTLCDGVFAPFDIPEPMCVAQALRAAGRITGPCDGRQLISQEWIYLRFWRYAAEFELPEDADERALILCENLAGRGQIYLNGAQCGRFEDQCWYADVTQWLQNGKNRLEIAFDPVKQTLPSSSRLWSFGVTRPVWLRTVNYASIAQLTPQPHMERGELCVHVRVNAHVAGKYIFDYQISLEGEALAHFEFVERLRACEAQCTHALKLSGLPDGEKSRQARYELRLSIRRAGSECDLIRAPFTLPPSYAGPAALLNKKHMAAGQDPLNAALDAARLMGVHTLVLPDECWANRLLPPDFPGFAASGMQNSGEIEWLQEEQAPVSLERLAELSGDMAPWPPSVPVWKIFSSTLDGFQKLESVFGPNAGGDAGRALRLMRAMQAERMRARVFQARNARKRAGFTQAIESAPALASCALIEYPAVPRPAYFAVRDALLSPIALVELPETPAFPCGSKACLPVYLMGEDCPRQAVTIQVSAFAPDGALAASAVFNAFTGAIKRVGEVSISMPNRRAVFIVRAAVCGENGAVLSQTDALICAYGEGDAPLAALLSPPPAQIDAAGSVLANTGSVAALALSICVEGDLAAGQYRALLPGERFECPSGRSIARVEGLNLDFSILPRA